MPVHARIPRIVMGFHRGFQYSGTKYFGHQQAAHANRLTIVVDGRGYTSSRELSPSSPYISELHSTIATERSHTRMRLHTSVMSLGPLHSYKGAPPDMLSGGGRQILASYTEFSHQGNFLDAACRLIDTLPHQSPAIGVRCVCSPLHLRTLFSLCRCCYCL